MSRFAQKGIAWAICQRCGFKYGYHQIVTETDTGARVCYRCKNRPEPTFHDIGPPAEDFTINFTRIPPSEAVIPPDCSIIAVADFAIADCAIADACYQFDGRLY